VTRALRALSSAYVQRRAKLTTGAALSGRGKRAAFALFYGPLHFATIDGILERLALEGEDICAHRTIADLGCGTGAGGAAWGLRCSPASRVAGYEINPWAADEANWTYRFFGLDGVARRSDLATARVDRQVARLAAYTLNELPEDVRRHVLADALDSASALLIVEPISRAVTPWWDEAARFVANRGGRADDWKLPLDMPDRWKLLDRAAGFRRDHLSARSLWLPPSRRLT